MNSNETVVREIALLRAEGDFPNARVVAVLKCGDRVTLASGLKDYSEVVNALFGLARLIWGKPSSTPTPKESGEE